MFRPSKSIANIYKSFIRFYLGNGDIVSKRLEAIQDDASLAITETIPATQENKLSQKLGLECHQYTFTFQMSFKESVLNA